MQKKDDIYFDDCPICQLMEKTDLEKSDVTMSKIMKAFKKAKKNPGAICKSFKY